MAFMSGAWSRLLGDLQIAEWLESPARPIIHAFRPPAPAVEIAEEILHRHLYRLHRHPGVQLPEVPTWDEDPLCDRNWQMWHHSLLPVSYLTQAYEASKRIEFLVRASGMVENWISVFVHSAREHPMAWHDHVIAQRTLVLLEFAEAWRQHFREDIAFARRLLAALYHHGSLLTEPHIYRLRHNHGIEQDRALLELAILVPQWPESEAWRQLAWNRLLEQVRAAVSFEGTYFEHSPNYEGVVCLMLGQTRDFLVAHGRPHEEISHAIERLCEKIAFSIRPDGAWPPIGDSIAHPVDELLEHLRRTPSDGEHALYALSAGAEGIAPTTNHLILPSDGCAILRQTWERNSLRDSLHCYLTAAFNTRTHKHHDDLSFTVFAHGREILTDAGRHSYNYTDPRRRYCESVFGHNVVIVDRADTDTRRLNIGKSGITSAFSGKHVLGVDAVHYLYAGVDSRRLLLYFPPNVIVVFDRLSCDRDVSATQQFLFAPPWHVESIDGLPAAVRAVLPEAESNGPVVDMVQLMPGTAAPRVIRGQEEPLVGWVSRQHGSFEPACAVHTEASGTAMEFVTAFVIHPRASAVAPPMGSADWDGTTLRCALSIGDESWDFSYQLDALRARVGFRGESIESSIWPTPFEYRTRRSLARPAARKRLQHDGEAPRVEDRLCTISAQVEQIEAGQRQTVESLHRQINQLQSGLRTIQNKLNGASMRRIDHLERENEVLAIQVRQLSRRVSKAEKTKRLLREKTERAQGAALTLREGARDRHGELVQLRGALKKLEKSEEALRKKLERATQKQRVEHERFLHSQAQLWDTMNSVRWRIGDAFVRAMRPSLDTLKLPFRLVKCFFAGLKRRADLRRNPPGATVVGATTPGPAAVVQAPREPSPIVKNARALALAPRRGVRVACILDEFSYECFESEADWNQLLPDTWRQQVDELKPELLFVESAWKGKGEAWRHLVSTDRREGNGPLKDLIDHCRSRNIPTVFWNKEDPANYEHFIGSAVWFDHILTTDSDCIDRYAKAAGHRRVDVLPFAAQPRIHNPIGRKGGDLGNVCFAGTWYAAKHDGRAEDARIVLEPALEFGLHIYDRMFGFSGPGWQNYLYPPEYQDAIRGGLPYEEMLDAYKRYHVFLNVNSVRTSPTMCSRRVFEILACGTNVISAYAPSIENLLGPDCVHLTRSTEETRRYLSELLGDEAARNRMSVRAIRKVMADHTCAHRFAEVLAMLGMGSRIEPTRVACIFPVNTANEIAAARRFLDDAAGLHLEPVWIAPDSLSIDAAGCIIRANAENGASKAGAIATAIGELAADYVFLWSARMSASAATLADLVHAFAYYGGDAVCKPANDAPDRLIFAETGEAPLGATLLRTASARRLPSSAFESAESFATVLRSSGLRIFATDTVGIRAPAVESPATIFVNESAESNGGDVNGNGHHDAPPAKATHAPAVLAQAEAPVEPSPAPRRPHTVNS